MNSSPSSETVSYDADKLGGLRRRLPHPRLRNFKGRQAKPFTSTRTPGSTTARLATGYAGLRQKPKADLMGRMLSMRRGGYAGT